MMPKTGSNQQVLVFSAHPDDHLCSAGTLMYLKDLGFSLKEVVFTGGDKGIWLGNPVKDRKIDQSKLIKQRQHELSQASKIIGIKQTIFLGLADSKITRSIQLIEQIIKIVRHEKPKILITQNPDDYHHDHRELGRVSTEAIDRAAWGIAKELGEPYRVPIVLYMEGSYFGRSHLLIDTTKYRKQKESVFAAYSSQTSQRSRRMLEAMNTYRGYYKRSQFAECFEIPKELPIYFDELVEIFSDAAST